LPLQLTNGHQPVLRSLGGLGRWIKKHRAAQASTTPQTRIQAGAVYAPSWQNMSVRPGWIYPGGTAGWPYPHNLSWSRWMPNGAKATGKLSLWNHCGRTPIATCKPSVYNATV
jgi:hypothetical protein